MKKHLTTILAALLLNCHLVFAATADEPRAGSDATVTAVHQQVLMNNKDGAVGTINLTCYSDGAASVQVSVPNGIRLLAGQRLSVKPAEQAVEAMQYTAVRDGEMVRLFTAWSHTGCALNGGGYEVSLESASQGQSQPLAYSVATSKNVTHYYGGYLGTTQLGTIGYFNEACYSDGTANISVFLYRNGVQLNRGQTLTLTPRLREQFIVSYTAAVTERVTNFAGFSTIGCVAPKTAINLDIVTPPPPPASAGSPVSQPMVNLWQVIAHVFWF